jgi:hypothetical protein
MCDAPQKGPKGRRELVEVPEANIKMTRPLQTISSLETKVSLGRNEMMSRSAMN